MCRLPIALASLVFLAGRATSPAQEAPIYSGPQPGEAVPEFSLTAVHGAESGTNVNLVDEAGSGPLFVIFVHERTRPAFGLMNAVARFAESRADAGLTSGVAFLSADPTATENWLRQVTRHLPKKTTIGFSPDGQEGPGSWGLNRNVAMTIVVAREGRVTANFALVQPSVAQDGPKILKAVVEVTGGGEVPDIAEFSNQRMERRTADSAPDRQLRALLRPVINKQAAEEDVVKAAESVEAYLANNPEARKQVGQIAARIVDSGRLENYGTPRAQEFLRQWAEKYAADAGESRQQSRTSEESPDDR